jgi:hypothetical protein
MAATAVRKKTVSLSKKLRSCLALHFFYHLACGVSRACSNGKEIMEQGFQPCAFKVLAIKV